MPEQTKPPPTPKEASKEKEVAPGKLFEQTKPPSTTQEASKEKEAAQSKAPKPSSQSVAKADPLPSTIN